MKRRSIISCANSTTTFFLIIGATFFVATALATMLLGMGEHAFSSLQSYFMLASSLFWMMFAVSYMNMTAYYLDDVIKRLASRQATFTKEDIFSKLKPCTSPLVYSVVVVAMGLLAIALAGFLSWSSEKIDGAVPPSAIRASFQVACFLLGFFSFMAIGFTFVRYKVIKRLLGLLPSVDAWKDEDSYMQMETELEHDDLILQVKLFKSPTLVFGQLYHKGCALLRRAYKQSKRK